MASALYSDSSAAREERLGSFSEQMGKTACVHPGSRKSQAILGWFSPVANFWQLLTAGGLEEPRPFSFLQASASSNPKRQVYGERNGFFL